MTPERRARSAAPVVNRCSRRGRGHTGDFAEVDVIRQLQEIAAESKAMSFAWIVDAAGPRPEPGWRLGGAGLGPKLDTENREPAKIEPVSSASLRRLWLHCEDFVYCP